MDNVLPQKTCLLHLDNVQSQKTFCFSKVYIIWITYNKCVRLNWKLTLLGVSFFDNWHDTKWSLLTFPSNVTELLWQFAACRGTLKLGKFWPFVVIQVPILSFRYRLYHSCTNFTAVNCCKNVCKIYVNFILNGDLFNNQNRLSVDVLNFVKVHEHN